MPERIPKWIERNRERPDLPGSATVLSRTAVPYDELSTKDLEGLGFLRSIVAVPEAGQSSIVTYRHPTNNLHFHRHDDRWLYHEDEWPAFAMTLQRLRDAGSSTPMRTLLREEPNAVWGAAAHGIVEGIPGYANYLGGRILGRPTFTQLLDGDYTPKSLSQQLGRTAAVSTAAALPFLAFRRPSWAGKAMGAVAGFAGAQELGRRLGLSASAQFEPASVPWMLSRTAYGAALPAMGAVGGALAGRSTANYIKGLRRRGTEDSDKEEERKRLRAKTATVAPGYVW